jgi:flagellar basal-body rod protein FlgB
MNLPDVPLLSLLRERMTWLHQRQDVLSQNVANADTPGYVARDLKAQDFSDILSGETMRGNTLMATDPRHISLSSTTSSRFEEQASADQGSPNGNAVSLEEEMIKVSETQAQFQAAANLYAKAMTMMKTAIGH